MKDIFFYRRCNNGDVEVIVHLDQEMIERLKNQRAATLKACSQNHSISTEECLGFVRDILLEAEKEEP